MGYIQCTSHILFSLVAYKCKILGWYAEDIYSKSVTRGHSKSVHARQVYPCHRYISILSTIFPLFRGITV